VHVLYTCASVTKQYNLVTANGRRCSAAVEGNLGPGRKYGSLPPGLWLPSPVDWVWLPRTGIGSGTLHLFRVWDYLYMDEKRWATPK